MTDRSACLSTAGVVVSGLQSHRITTAYRFEVRLGGRRIPDGKGMVVPGSTGVVGVEFDRIGSVDVETQQAARGSRARVRIKDRNGADDALVFLKGKGIAGNTRNYGRVVDRGNRYPGHVLLGEPGRRIDRLPHEGVVPIQIIGRRVGQGRAHQSAQHPLAGNGDDLMAGQVLQRV